MFNFFKKNTDPLVTKINNISRDIHSHILPGLDDGAPDIETSLELINGLNDLGISKFIATPHIIGDMYRNTPETINGALQKVKIACAKANINIELTAAAEYMLDDHFMRLLRNKEPLLTLERNLILTELSYVTPPDKLEVMSFEIITAGYQPIMAHPERYFFYHKNYDGFLRLKELGFFLQVNLLSLIGYYGIATGKAAKFIFENNLADFVGTDIHHSRHLELLSKSENLAIFKKYLGDKIFNDFAEITF
jgi:protein-tyrosine phosphatase